MKEEFDFSKEPGIKILNNRKYEEEKEPIISVIIPFYNDKKYIEQSVNCILNQTFPYYEILIIDDGSKDEESLKKLEEVSKIDKRIRVFHKISNVYRFRRFARTNFYGMCILDLRNK